MVKATPEEAGCWIDGNWGHYSSARLIHVANIYGWEAPEALRLAMQYMAGTGISGEEVDLMHEFSYEAEEWLNENVAPEGYSFGWSDSEFFLMSNGWWEEL